MKKMSIRLTKTRLDIIISALAYYKTLLDDGESVVWDTDAEYRHLEREREQAFRWAHQELAKRKSNGN